MDHARIEATIKRLAIEGGALIMEIYESADLGVRSKDDNSPVTLADEAANAHIHAGLVEAFPDIPVVTEEQAESQTDHAPALFFIVDPLDGTKEFVQRRGDFTVNIALVENGKPLRGVGIEQPPLGGRIDHAASWRTIFDQSDVYREIAAALDEFLCAVKRVDQYELTFAVAAM